MPRGFLVKRCSYLAFPSQDKPLSLNKVRSPASSSSTGSASSSGASYGPILSPQSDRPESPEPQVLDLRLSSIVYSPSLHSIVQVPSIARRKSNVPNSNRAPSNNGQKRKSSPSSGQVVPRGKVTNKKLKAIRKLTFDDRKSSPVSGTIIKYSDSEEDDDVDDLKKSAYIHRTGDIDPSFNIVIVSDEARAELAKIENRIGDYNCMLCRDHFADAFTLAQHRCPRIIHIEYRCTECEKVFNCPANLASHRRWHKPRVSKLVTEATTNLTTPTTTVSTDCAA